MESLLMRLNLHIVQRPVKTRVAHGSFVDLHSVLHSGGMRLKEIRELRGLTQRDLGEMIGMDAATIHRAEKMAPTAKLSTYVKCAEALAVSLEDIFAESFSPMERDLVELFRGASPETREHLVGLLRARQTEIVSRPPETVPGQLKEEP